MTGDERAGPASFYARRGSTIGDLVTLLHVPYTMWHLGYVAIGAGLAVDLDWVRFGGTVAAFAVGLGISAHALDEVHDRPLDTALPDAVLWTLALGGFAVVAGISIGGAFLISPWVLVWAAAGIILASGYALEWWAVLHSDWGFAVVWGAFPVLAAHWAQVEGLDWTVMVAAGATTLISKAQRALSTPARRIRRRTRGSPLPAGLAREGSDEASLLETWEVPLHLLSYAIPLLGAALVLRHL